MFPALRPNGIARWLAVVLALFGLAAAQCLAIALSAGRARGSASATARATAAGPAQALDAAGLLDTGEPEGTRREPMRELDGERGERARGATETLARALESPAFEEASWRAAVENEARTLGTDALPALQALLADESRSPEEHVAASELVAALRAQ